MRRRPPAAGAGAEAEAEDWPVFEVKVLAPVGCVIWGRIAFANLRAVRSISDVIMGVVVAVPSSTCSGTDFSSSTGSGTASAACSFFL